MNFSMNYIVKKLCRNTFVPRINMKWNCYKSRAEKKLAMLTSPHEWKFFKRHENRKRTNQCKRQIKLVEKMVAFRDFFFIFTVLYQVAIISLDNPWVVGDKIYNFCFLSLTASDVYMWNILEKNDNSKCTKDEDMPCSSTHWDTLNVLN